MHSAEHLVFADVSVSLSVTLSGLIWCKVHCIYSDEGVVIGFVVVHSEDLTGIKWNSSVALTKGM